MELLSKAIQQPDAVVRELLVWQCKISANGAQFIADMLKGSKTLKVLVMHGNDVGDIGIAKIASVFGQCTIRELHINHCGFGYNGAKSLADSLKSDTTVKHLKLWGNPITPKGAHLMAKLVANSDLKIDMNKEYMEDAEDYNCDSNENDPGLTGNGM